MLQILAAAGPLLGIVLRHYLPSLGNLLPGGSTTTPTVKPVATPAAPSTLWTQIESQLEAAAQAELQSALSNFVAKVTSNAGTAVPNVQTPKS